MESYLQILLPNHRHEPLAGKGDLWNLMHPAAVSEVIVSVITRVFCLKTELIPNVISIPWEPIPVVPNALSFSDDGLIYYTEDHYESFELLYGKE